MFEDNVTVWRRNLCKLQSFIEARSEEGGHDRRPSNSSKDTDEKFLASWIGNQKHSYAQNTGIMKDPAIRKEWQSFVDSYSEVFEDNVTTWRRNLRSAQEFIEAQGKDGDQQKRRPSKHSKDLNEKKLGEWIIQQQGNFARQLQIMKNPDIRKEWQSFVDAHRELFEDNVTVWRRNLRNLQIFIEAQGSGDGGHKRKRPSNSSKDPNEKRLARWIQSQQINYARKVDIMKNPEIREEWQAFVDAHRKLFEDNVTVWRRNLRSVHDFIQTQSGEEGQQKRRPSKESKDADEKKLGVWISNQQKTYARNLDIMKDPEIRKEWQVFVDAHSELFEDNVTIWRRNLRNLQKFIEAPGGGED
eukprot:2104257-Pleurochrysis_carterae.AAC.1